MSNKPLTLSGVNPLDASRQAAQSAHPGDAAAAAHRADAIVSVGGGSTTGRDPRVLPAAIVYDPSVMLTLPVEMSVASGLNALAHRVDSLWAPNADAINAALAVEGVRALIIGLPEVVRDPSGLDGREHALYGAYLAAVAFASAGG
ncbi:iron-containing alcohol dehydrogenase [Amycolatopsis sp. NPDC059021]|uniref:iron-containing alcohol dehydrogenase n=1 Tax=Amycolatopsis sp. NPDC059021 TaxID=3346704 RepID=UPI0036725F1E